MVNRNISCIGFCENYKNSILSFLGSFLLFIYLFIYLFISRMRECLIFFLGELEMSWQFLGENETLNVFLSLFSFSFYYQMIFLISLKLRMVLSYSFMVYVCEEMPIRS